MRARRHRPVGEDVARRACRDRQRRRARRLQRHRHLPPRRRPANAERCPLHRLRGGPLGAARDAAPSTRRCPRRGRARDRGGARPARPTSPLEETRPMRPDALAGCDRILLVRPDNVGDVVLLAPAIRAIREAHRDAVIGLLASPAGPRPFRCCRGSTRSLSSRSSGRTRRRHRCSTRNASSSSSSGFATAGGTRWSSSPASRRRRSVRPTRRTWPASRSGRAMPATSAARCSRHAVPPPDWEVHQAERALDLVEGLGIDVADRSAAIAVPPDARHAAQRLLGGDRRPTRWRLHPRRARRQLRRAALPAGAICGRGRNAVIRGRGCRSSSPEPERRPTGWALRSAGSRESISVMGRTSIPELAALVAALGSRALRQLIGTPPRRCASATGRHDLFRDGARIAVASTPGGLGPAPARDAMQPVLSVRVSIRDAVRRHRALGGRRCGPAAPRR